MKKCKPIRSPRQAVGPAVRMRRAGRHSSRVCVHAGLTYRWLAQDIFLILLVHLHSGRRTLYAHRDGVCRRGEYVHRDQKRWPERDRRLLAGAVDRHRVPAEGRV